MFCCAFAGLFLVFIVTFDLNVWVVVWGCFLLVSGFVVLLYFVGCSGLLIVLVSCHVFVLPKLLFGLLFVI